MRRRPWRLVLDVDGVVASFIDGALRDLVAFGGPELAHDEITTWNVELSVPEEFRARLMAEWLKPRWCASLPAYAGAFEAVREFRGLGDVVFATAPLHESPFWMFERDRWLRDLMGAMGREIVFTSAKHLIAGDMMIDDKPANVEEWAADHPGGLAILWDRPYNRSASLSPGIIRTNSWDRALKLAAR